MNAPNDPWQARLSEYLDGELGSEERGALEVHLAGCASCRDLLADLGRLVRTARALPAREPEHDLWPALADALAARSGRRAWRPWVLAFAAGVLVTLGAVMALRGGAEEDERVASRGENYLLLLHESEDFGAGESAEEHARIVARYTRWASELGARCLAGDELESAGLELFPGAAEPREKPAGERIGGYFLVEVADRREALALARTCPHLEQGGWIELRRIRAQK